MSPFVTQAFSMEAHVHFPFQCVLIAEAERDQSYFLETRRQCCVPDTQQGRVDFTKEMFTLILTPFCSGYYQQYSLISTSTINWRVGLKRLWGGGRYVIKTHHTHHCDNELSPRWTINKRVVFCRTTPPCLSPFWRSGGLSSLLTGWKKINNF